MPILHYQVDRTPSFVSEHQQPHKGIYLLFSFLLFLFSSIALLFFIVIITVVCFSSLFSSCSLNLNCHFFSLLSFVDLWPTTKLLLASMITFILFIYIFFIYIYYIIYYIYIYIFFFKKTFCENLCENFFFVCFSFVLLLESYYLFFFLFFFYYIKTIVSVVLMMTNNN